MPISKSITEGKASALKKESVSSASQLSNFGVRMAKFTHKFSVDGAADFNSNLVLPEGSAILGVSINVTEAYNGTTVTADIKAGGSTIITTPLSVATSGVLSAAAADLANESGELSIDFSATDSTAGECTVAVAYIDLTEIK